MLFPAFPTTDLTDIAKPIYEYREILSKSRGAPYASIETANFERKNVDESPRTELSYIGKTELGSVNISPLARPDTKFSTNYIDFNRQSLLRSLGAEISEWISKGNTVGLPHIVNIKRLLNSNAEYLEQVQDTRLLLGALELIIDNNDWNVMPENKLRFLKSKIDYLAENELDFDQVQKFIKEIHTSKIRVLKPGYGKEEQKTKKEA